MAKNMDSTVYLDYWGNRGFMEGLEYRYALKRDTYGEARFHFIKDKEYDGKRYAFFVQHEQKLPQDFYLKGDINYVSDNTFPQDFPDYLPATTKIDARSLQQVRSVVFGGKNWDRFSLLANAEYFEILSRENNKITVQKLPQVSLYGYPQTLLNTPLFYDFAVSYTNFWRREGVEAQRWDFLPELLLPMRVFNVLKVEPNVGFRETLYLPYNDPTGVFNKWESRETFETGLRMSTEFYRVYEGSRENKILKAFNVGKWMHTIEPTVSYTYIPRVNQDKIPFFDEVDRISYTNAVTYGFITRLLGKPWQETREHRPQEFFKFQVTQSYSFGDPFSLDEEGKRRDFSNIQGQLWANFSPYVNARADVEFNPYDINFPRVNGLISVRDRRNDAILFEYLETKDQIKQANVFARIKVVEGFHVYGGIRYNLLYNTAVENDYGAEYQAQCWTLGVLVQDIKPSPDGSVKGEWKFQFYLNLLNLGAVGHKAVMMQF
jgi:LPS-assembly protein